MPLSTFLLFAHQFGFDGGGGDSGSDPALHSVCGIEESTVVEMAGEFQKFPRVLLSRVRNVLGAFPSPQRVVGANSRSNASFCRSQAKTKAVIARASHWLRLRATESHRTVRVIPLSSLFEGNP